MTHPGATHPITTRNVNDLVHDTVGGPIPASSGPIDPMGVRVGEIHDRIEAVLRTMGVGGHWPIIVAFTILAAYTYQSGLRAPALIAFVKDSLIYIVVLVAVIYIPIKLGGFDEIFGAADEKFDKSPQPTDGVLLANAQVLGYSTLAFGSAAALFLFRIRSRRCSPRAAATRSSATWQRCRRTRWCSRCSPCWDTWRSRPA